MNWHHIEKNYQLKNELNDENNWKYFLNQIIHSFTFIPVFNGKKFFEGIMLNSDKTKNKYLYFIPLREIIKLILKISEGSIVNSLKERKIEVLKNGRKVPKEMRQINAEYAYPIGFNLDEIVENSIKGIMYIRNKDNYK